MTVDRTLHSERAQLGSSARTAVASRSRTAPINWRPSATSDLRIVLARQDVHEIHGIGLVDVACLSECALRKMLLEVFIDHPPVNNLASAFDKQELGPSHFVYQHGHANWHIVDVADSHKRSTGSSYPRNTPFVVVMFLPQEELFSGCRFNDAENALEE